MRKNPVRRMWFQLFAFAAIVFFIGSACGLSGGPKKLWAGQIVRDLDTTGTQYKALYINEGSSTETQKLYIYSQGGAWNAAEIGFSKSGNQLTEFLKMQGVRTFENYGLMTSEQQSENVLDITESKYALLRWVDTQNVVSQASKNEIAFAMPGLLQDGYKYQSNWQIPMDKEIGEPDFSKAVSWYDEIISDTILGNTWRPYSVVIKDSILSKSLHANWAQTNMEFDAAMYLAKQMVTDLNAHNWTDLDPKYGKIKMVIFNKNNALELIAFENPFYGKIVMDNGQVVNFRVKPGYVVLDPNLYFGWAKANSKNGSLQSLVWQVQTGSDPNNDASWTNAAGMYFLKGRFAANSLYVIKVWKPGENSDTVTFVNALKAEMDSDIPEDIKSVMDGQIDEGSDMQKRIMNWVASRKPFDLGALVKKYNLGVAALVRYDDISDKITVLEPCGEDCSRYVTKVTTPRKQLVWNIAVGPTGIEDTNDILAMGSEIVMKAFDIGYVQPGAGDGMSYIFGALRSYTREQMAAHQDPAAETKISTGYQEAVRLDQRSPNSPEGIEKAANNVLVPLLGK